MRLIGSTLEWNEKALRDYAPEARDRGGREASNVGTARQVGAIINSGDRTAEIRRIRCRSLIIHGEKDLMVATNGGFATAAAIRGSNHGSLTVWGMTFRPACRARCYPCWLGTCANTYSLLKETRMLFYCHTGTSQSRLKTKTKTKTKRQNLRLHETTKPPITVLIFKTLLPTKIVIEPSPSGCIMEHL